MEHQTYIWNLYPARDARKAHAKRLREIGVTHVQVKAGGDDGRLWESWTNHDAVAPYREEGLYVSPWFYTWPTVADREVVRRAMAAQPFERYSLNPEVEWRTDSNRNPWRNIGEANEGADAWLLAMEQLLPSIERRFSGVPSWTGFPYEAWCRHCDAAEPQHYWPRNMLADVYGRDFDEVGYHRLRGGDEIPCVPIITASREYVDPAVVALARGAFADFPTLDGFSFWEAGNAAFQWDAAKAILDFLPDAIEVRRGENDQWARSWVDPQTGVPQTQILWGGQATHVIGTDFRDIGIKVGGVPDGEYIRSIQGGEFQEWVRL